MRTIVRPHAPIIAFSFGVFAVLVVQEGNYLVQHRLGYRQAGAEHRAGELEGEVGADPFIDDEILQAPRNADAGGIVKLDPFIDPLVDRILQDGIKVGLGKPLAGFEVALIEQLIARCCHPN